MTNRISAVIVRAAVRPAVGDANVRSMNDEASVGVRCASVQGITPMITVLITIYSVATTAIDSTMARGTVRLGSRTSSAMLQTLL